MQYWWVNQNQTYNHEVRGGYLWSPKTKANGGQNRFYHAMTEVASGDVIFSFADTLIKAIGIASGPSESAPKPSEFKSAGANWATEGWYVPVEFTTLEKSIRPKDHVDRLKPVLPAKYSPLQENGNGNQGVYLTPVPEDMAQVLIALLEGQVEKILAKASNTSAADDTTAIAKVLSDDGLKVTQRTQLIQARMGQGLFRSRVTEIESRCRVTGIADVRFLIASHIKPWSRSSNVERLDGSNGLLLAPHIDRLFDKGFITFVEDGELRVSERLPPEVQAAWDLESKVAPMPLSAQQEAYMAYHRAEVFLG